jgi:hypothetical protein
MEVQLLGDNVAILAYTVHEELTADGKPVALDAADASTWVRRNDRWAMFQPNPASGPASLQTSGVVSASTIGAMSI